MPCIVIEFFDTKKYSNVENIKEKWCNLLIFPESQIGRHFVNNIGLITIDDGKNVHVKNMT